jgi:hypothetical protein
MTDPAMIQDTASVLFQPGTIVELRIPNTPRQGTVSGYFDNAQAFLQAAQHWSGKAPAVYCTLNPCAPALLARAANRLKERVKTTTSDPDILQRCWFPLDFDPVRPADISSTAAEHDAALQRAVACTEWLTHRGWPLPVAADSGNGAHRLYRVDLPNDDATRALLQRCLEALALYFSDSEVALDVKVFNAARIWKVYGTLACKGDHLPERPHRLSELLDVPAPLACVTPQHLADLAALLPAPAASPPRRGMTAGAPFDLPGWIRAHGLPVVAEGAWQQSGYRWVLNPCPWDSAHTNRSAFVVQVAQGGIAAGCHHNGCSGHDWQDLRALYEPGYQPYVPPATFHAGSNGHASVHGQTTTPPQPASWTDHLNKTKGGEVRETFDNLAFALEHLAPWHTDSWYDLVRDRGMLGATPLDEPHVWAAARAIEQETAMPIRNLKLVRAAIIAQCRQRARDPIREWLEGLPPWDGQPRILTWLPIYTGATPTSYSGETGRLWLVSMVARGLQPGCQCRSVIVLMGDEDIGKSKLVKLLASEDWYRDVSGSLEGKEAHMLMKGTWLVELGELSSLGKTEEARLKAFITQANDEYVPKYANDPIKHARRTILVGTLNPEGDKTFLRGQTGNTRYYPVGVTDIKLEAVEARREQLFAEALVHYRAHLDDWWRLSPEAEKEARAIRDEHRVRSVYEEPLSTWLEGRKLTCWQELCEAFLLLEAKERWKDTKLQKDMAQAMVACGWKQEKQQRVMPYGVVRPWVPR